jgi:hypothetical protein
MWVYLIFEGVPQHKYNISPFWEFKQLFNTKSQNVYTIHGSVHSYIYTWTWTES